MDQNSILQHGGPQDVRARAFQNFVLQHGLVQQQAGPIFSGQDPASTQSSLSSTGSFNIVQISGTMTQPMELDRPDMHHEVRALEQALADSYEEADLQTRQQLHYQEQSFFHVAAQYQATARVITTEAEQDVATRLTNEYMAMHRADRESSALAVQQHMIAESTMAEHALATQKKLFGEEAHSFMQALTTEDAQARHQIMMKADEHHADMWRQAQIALATERENVRQAEASKETLRSQAATVINTEAATLQEVLAQRDYSIQQEQKFARAHDQMGRQFNDINAKFSNLVGEYQEGQTSAATLKAQQERMKEQEKRLAQLEKELKERTQLVDDTLLEKKNKQQSMPLTLQPKNRSSINNCRRRRISAQHN
jgi:uncharacterized protein YutD